MKPQSLAKPVLALLPKGEGQALLFAVPPLLVTSFAQLLFELSAFDLLPLGETLAGHLQGLREPGLMERLAEAENRTLWSLSVLLNFATATALTAASLLILGRMLIRGRLRLSIPVALLLIAAGLGSLIFAAAQATPMSGIFFFTYDGLMTVARYTPFYLGAVHIQVTILNVFSVVTPVVALIAGCTTLIPPESQGEEALAALKARMSSVRLLLALGSAYMVAGVLHMGVWMRWPAALVHDELLATRIQDLALAISIYWGGAFTLMIAAFFGPCIVVLSRRAETVIARNPALAGDQAPRQFLLDQGFSLSMTQKLPDILAVLAPLIAGPIGAAAVGLSGAVSSMGN